MFIPKYARYPTNNTSEATLLDPEMTAQYGVDVDVQKIRECMVEK